MLIQGRRMGYPACTRKDGLYIDTEPRMWYGKSWWRHQMETFSVLLALCEGNQAVTGGEFPSQRASIAGFDVFFGVNLNKRLNKQLSHRWSETPGCSLWRHCNGCNSHFLSSTSPYPHLRGDAEPRALWSLNDPGEYYTSTKRMSFRSRSITVWVGRLRESWCMNIK